MAVIQVEVNKAVTLEQRFYADGVLTNASSAVTVTLTRADGTALATAAATTNPSTGVYRYVLAPQTTLDYLTVVWSGTWSGQAQMETNYVEIVGDFYLTLVECRSLDPRFSATASPYVSDEEIRRVRAEVEQAIEAEAGAAFVPRFSKETVNGSGTRSLILRHTHPRVLRSLRTYTSASAFTTYTAAQLADVTYTAHGELGSWSTSFAHGHRNLVVTYEHGLDSPPPLIRQAARMLFAVKLLEELVTTDPTLANVRSLSVEGYSVTYAERSLMELKAIGRIEQWKRSTTPAGVAIA